MERRVYRNIGMRAKDNHLFNLRYFRANADLAVCIPMRNLSDREEEKERKPKTHKNETPKPK